MTNIFGFPKYNEELKIKNLKGNFVNMRGGGSLSWEYYSELDKAKMLAFVIKNGTILTANELLYLDDELALNTDLGFGELEHSKIKGNLFHVLASTRFIKRKEESETQEEELTFLIKKLKYHQVDIDFVYKGMTPLQKAKKRKNKVLVSVFENYHKRIKEINIKILRRNHVKRTKIWRQCQKENLIGCETISGCC